MQNEADKAQDQDIKSLSKKLISLSSLVGQINTIQGEHTESLMKIQEVQTGLETSQNEM